MSSSRAVQSSCSPRGMSGCPTAFGASGFHLGTGLLPANGLYLDCIGRTIMSLDLLQLDLQLVLLEVDGVLSAAGQESNTGLLDLQLVLQLVAASRPEAGQESNTDWPAGSAAGSAGCGFTSCSWSGIKHRLACWSRSFSRCSCSWTSASASAFRLLAIFADSSSSSWAGVKSTPANLADVTSSGVKDRLACWVSCSWFYSC